jgi:REP element-mobilizing transposase RayT
MPGGARLDAPGTLHHVMLRGIERGNIVYEDEDREDFLARMGDHAQATGTGVYAWALMDNHAHILLRSGTEGLQVFMRRFLTGYAVAFNRRHGAATGTCFRIATNPSSARASGPNVPICQNRLTGYSIYALGR